MAGYKDRHFFGEYYLSDDGITVCGSEPKHIFPQGKIAERFLVFVLLSEDEAPDNVDEIGKQIEFADMPLGVMDDFCSDYDNALEGLRPYASQVVAYDLSKEKDKMDIVEQRAFLLHPDFVGRTFDEVCVEYPIEYTTTTNEDGSISKKANIWRNSNEGYPWINSK